MAKSAERIALETQLVNLLTKAQAHIGFEDAVKDIAPVNYGKTVQGIPYTLWQLIEHMRIAQKDILDFSCNPDYKYPKWPDDYWPDEKGPASAVDWNNSVKAIRDDRNAFIDLMKRTDDLMKPFNHGDGQNMLREALLIADHNAYHIGQIILLRRALSDFGS